MRNPFFCIGLVLTFASAQAQVSHVELFDQQAARTTPLAIYEPLPSVCTQQCPVALFGTGYKEKAGNYSFIAQHLADMGYFTIVLQHDIEGDVGMPNSGNIWRDREPFWRRGVGSMKFVIRTLSERFSQHSWKSVTVMGHSNGGDIAALFASENEASTKTLVTFDNRRFPLPAGRAFAVQTFRSSDQPADSGVIPAGNVTSSQLCVLPVALKHDHMNNEASLSAKKAILAAMQGFLLHGRCVQPSV